MAISGTALIAATAGAGRCAESGHDIDVMVGGRRVTYVCRRCGYRRWMRRIICNCEGAAETPFPGSGQCGVCLSFHKPEQLGGDDADLCDGCRRGGENRGGA